MPRSSLTFLRHALPLALAAALAGCERKAAREYLAPKERPFVAVETPQQEPPARREVAWRPALAWTLPAGWKDVAPDGMNMANFTVGDADVAITALVSMEGKETTLVNMWRSVSRQEPLEEADAAKMLHDVPIAGATGRMFEFASESGGQRKLTVVAFTHRPEGSLFFKIQGTEAVVTAQKAAFFEFLKSVKFAEGAAPAPEPKPVSAWPGEVPAGWTAVAPGPMQQAKFSVPEKDGAKADVMVSIFPSETGGTVENVKRWRRQLKLADIPDDEVAKLAQPLAGVEGAIIVDLKNEARALTGAIVPHDGQWFFIKLLGDAPAVASAREAFVVFVTKLP